MSDFVTLLEWQPQSQLYRARSAALEKRIEPPRICAAAEAASDSGHRPPEARRYHQRSAEVADDIRRIRKVGIIYDVESFDADAYLRVADDDSPTQLEVHLPRTKPVQRVTL